MTSTAARRSPFSAQRSPTPTMYPKPTACFLSFLGVLPVSYPCAFFSSANASVLRYHSHGPTRAFGPLDANKQGSSYHRSPCIYVSKHALPPSSVTRTSSFVARARHSEDLSICFTAVCIECRTHTFFCALSVYTSRVGYVICS